jgi:membrane protease YdiL (CAAX protease family)
MPGWAEPGQSQPAAWAADAWQRPRPDTATWHAPAASTAPAPAWSGRSANWNLPGGGVAGAWTGGAASGWPAARPESWSVAGVSHVGSPGSWPIGFVPWGYSNPPPVPPVLEPPGRFHPGSPVRRVLSVAGRANPRSYRLGLILGLPAGLVLLAFEIAARGGFKLVASPLTVGVLLEFVGIVAALGLIAAALAQSGQRRADGWQDFVGPSPFLVGAAQYASVFALSLPAVALMNWSGIKSSSAVATLLLMPIYLATYVGLVHLLGVRTGALTWSDIIHPKRFSPDPEDWTSRSLRERLGWRPRTSRLRTWLRGPLGDFLLAASMLIPVMFASGLTNVVLLTVLGLNGSDIQSDVPTHPSATDVVMIFVAFAILVPIGEEILFRGYSTNAWARSLNGNSALIRAALFFAFVHVINTDSTDAWTSLRVAVDNFGARVPVAIALCWIYMRRRSLVASASLHGCYNGLIVLISAWATFQT